MNTIAFLVNGDRDSAMGQRARSFAHHLRDRFDIHLFYRAPRKLLSLIRFFFALLRLGPQAVYVFDMAYSGVLAASLYKGCTRRRIIIETGDAITELARAMDRGPLALRLTRWLEQHALRVADRLVVRSTYHKDWLAQQGIQAEVIQDGVDTDQFAPTPVDDLRRKYQLDGLLTVGLVGTSIWSAKLQICYGWDLIEVLRLLKDQPVAGILIGDGSGIPILQERCRQYGIEDRVRFLGRIPYEELPRYLGLIDVCLSTQTNDLPGRVRTTGKLPIYLAGGRYILASRVGEASRVLAPEMLVDYEGQVDVDYPRKLAERIRLLLDNRALLAHAQQHLALARSQFDYAVLAEKLAHVIDQALAPS